MSEIVESGSLRQDNSGRFQKGRRPLGRKPGSQNHAAKTVKEALLEALDRVGGPDYLEEVARSAARTYCMLLAKVLPHELKVAAQNDDIPLIIIKDYTGGRGASRT